MSHVGEWVMRVVDISGFDESFLASKVDKHACDIIVRVYIIVRVLALIRQRVLLASRSRLDVIYACLKRGRFSNK